MPGSSIRYYLLQASDFLSVSTSKRCIVYVYLQMGKTTKKEKKLALTHGP